MSKIEPQPSRAKQQAERRRPSRRTELIQVAPGDLEQKDVRLVERLRREAVRETPGLLISLALHASLLLVMALSMSRGASQLDQPNLQASWLSLEKIATKSEQPAVRIPIQIESFQPTRPSPPVPTTIRTPTPDTTAVGETVPVRPVGVSGALGGRDAGAREAILAGVGGKADAVERTLSSGLMWLVRQQQSGGNWQLHEGYPDAGLSVIRTDTGATALALLAFLGAGHTHQSGPHQPVVGKGLKWLVGIQKPNGDFHDHAELGRQTAYYAHSQATIAICESLVLTGDQTLRQPAQAAVDFLLASQHPTAGGWRYQPQTALSSGDLSVTGWALMALHTARMAGIDVPIESFQRAAIFLDSVQEQAGARYRYMPDDPSERVSPAMTAEGLLCRQWLGWPRDHRAQQDAVQYLLDPQFQPEWSAGRRNVYAWYYAAQTLHNLGGSTWDEWYPPVQVLLVENQVKVGSSKSGADIRGSWNPTRPPGADEEYSAKAGRLYVTAMCLLILETPFRHAPVYSQ